MKTLFGIAALVIGCGSMLYSPAFGNEDSPGKVITVDESYFSNWDKPIILDFKKIKDPSQMDDLLEEYIQKNFEGYVIRGRMFSMNEDRFLIAFSLKNDEDKKALVYFDVTDAYQRLNRGNSEAKKKVKELKTRHQKK
ncbi:hypothetical protein [uncultured Akkermansia sp.]|uniref:hypothetical protein n=1 Tax=uncultured Akkermansia sp. TaxID=512294 RepID=UPI00265D041C|nr:hypothetical protein [uncultured Akkermansia sp.]